MTVDLLHVTEILKTALLRDLGDEVDLLFRYGSCLKGTMHSYSDLDISYVPIHETTWHSITVMVDGMLCDLYPIHWSRLEEMANFENVSSTVLLDYQIVYQRSEAVGARLRALPARLQALQQPAARPAMLSKAQAYFQRTGYPYYLLRQAAANGHLLACLQQAQAILGVVFHTLALCNQAPIDTRKLAQVLALPQLPVNFAATVERLTNAFTPTAVLTVTEQLLVTTRELLLTEQRQSPDRETGYPAAFGTGYPELKNDLQHILLACEQQDRFGLNRPLISLYHELARIIAQANTGVAYTGFNSLAEYEQGFVAVGLPALLPYVETGDFAGLHQQCLAFDEALRQWLTQHGVSLHTFATVTALESYLTK